MPPARKTPSHLNTNASHDPSIWHSYPGGIHSLCKPNGLGKGQAFIGLDYFTNFFGLLNFLEIRTEGKIGDQPLAPWTPADWSWSPTHLQGQWRAGDMTLQLRTLLNGPDHAIIDCTLANASQHPFAGELAVLGDENLDTMGDWGKYSLAGQFHRRANSVVVHKKMSIGESSDAFPWISVTQYKGLIAWRWYELHDYWAVALGGGDWRYTVRPGVPHPERKRIKLREDQLSFAPQAVDGQDRWSFSRPVSLPADGAFNFQIQIAFRYANESVLNAASQQQLMKRAAKPALFDAALRHSKQQWEKRLAAIPQPRPALPPAWRDLYNKAWVAVYQNLLPPHSGGLNTFKTPVFSTNKVATACCAPCAWESVLGSLLISMVDLNLATQSLDAIINCMDEDGVLQEDLGLAKTSTLPSILAITAWSLHQRGMKSPWLKRWYTRLKLNWRQQYRYPTWKRFGLIMVRNYFYAYHNGHALLKIARALRRPASELAEIQHRLEDIRLSAQAFWNPDKQFFNANANASEGPLSQATILPGTNAELLIGMLGDSMTAEQKQTMLRFIHDRLLHGQYMVANLPPSDSAIGGTTTGTAADQDQKDFAIKPSAYLLLWPALKALDKNLFHTTVDRTLAGIAVSGDFAENYRLDGRMAHNHPMSFFGMFGVIWSVLCDERYAPRGLNACNWI